MNLSNPQLDPALRADPALAEAVEELTARLKAGEAVELDAWLACWVIFASSVRSARAAWVSSMRPSNCRCVAGWR